MDRTRTDLIEETTAKDREEEQLEKERLDASLAQLSPTCRDLLRLLGRGVSSVEAAEKLGMTNANTVYRRKNACLKRWRELFDGMNGLK